MAQRLDRPVTLLATFNGPVKIGKFNDGTLLVAGPDDQPVLIRDGAVMRLNAAASKPDGDLVFSYEGVLRAHEQSTNAGERSPEQGAAPGLNKQQGRPPIPGAS